jgi:hypothetical protein
MPQGVMVAIMFDKGDTLKETKDCVLEIEEDKNDGILELDPSVELERGESNACAGCSKSFGFRFEELWGGYSSQV